MFCRPKGLPTEIQKDLIEQFSVITNLLGITRQSFIAEYGVCLSESKYAFAGHNPQFEWEQLQKFKKSFLSS